MRFREYTATPEAIARARSIGLFGETGKRLARAARRSAQYTGELGNRRFRDYVLTVREDRIVWIERMEREAA